MWVIDSVNIEHFLVWKQNSHGVFFLQICSYPICKVHCLCWSVSNASFCMLYAWSCRSFFSILRILFEEIGNWRANSREDSTSSRFNRLWIVSIGAFVRIVLEHSRRLTKSIVSTSQILLQHHSINERLMTLLRWRKIFAIIVLWKYKLKVTLDFSSDRIDIKEFKLNAFLCFYRELNWIFFKKTKLGKNNGNNRETANPSFILTHPLDKQTWKYSFSESDRFAAMLASVIYRFLKQPFSTFYRASENKVARARFRNRAHVDNIDLIDNITQSSTSKQYQKLSDF